MNISHRHLSGIVFTFFFLSGITGLIYQVVWSKYLANIFGSSAYAYTIVLAVFMGGLAYGNHFFGRLADRFRIDLLYLYGLLEISIGVYCSLYPLIVTVVEKLYQLTGRQLGLGSTDLMLMLVQLALNSLIIFLPTTIMGGTLPVMVKYLTRRHSQLLENISRLYYINSAGAVVGTLVCGFFLIRLYGLDTTISLAALFNICIGVLSLLIVRNLHPAQQTDGGEGGGTGSERTAQNSAPDCSSERRTTPFEKKAPVRASPAQVRIVLWAIGLSGFVSMLYEVLWIRTLVQFFGSSVYSFSLVVGAFIAGISLGSAYLSSCQHRIKNIYFCFGWVQGLICLLMYLCVQGINQLPAFIWKLQLMFTPAAFVYPFFLFSKFLFVFLVLLLPTFFIGMTLPLAGTICSKNFQLLGREVGDVFSVNTFGALLGTAVTGLVFLPHWGVYPSFLIGIYLNFFLSAWVLLSHGHKKTRLTCLLISVIFVVLNLTLPLRPDKKLMLTSMFRYRGDPELSFQEYSNSKSQGQEILFFKEGAVANVAVVRQFNGLSLMINGKSDASTMEDMPSQLLCAHLPALLHANPRRALVIGFGSGVTAGALTLYPSIKKVDCLEIAPEVIEAGEYFKDYNYDCLHNHKLQVIVDDAKNYLSVNKEKYDLIVSEPTNPWTAGVGAIMTKEAFERMRDSLNDDGVVLQWFHTYAMSDQIFQTIAATFLEVFPYVTIWQSTLGDCFFVGTMKPLAPDYAKMAKVFAEPSAVRNSLKKIHVENMDTLLSTQLLSNQKTHALFYRASAINRDRFPFIEFNAPMAFFLNDGVSVLASQDQRQHPYKKDPLYIEKYLSSHPLDPQRMSSFYYFFRKSDPGLMKRLVWEWEETLFPLLDNQEEEITRLESIRYEKIALDNALNHRKKLQETYPASFGLFWSYLQQKVGQFNLSRSIFSQAGDEKKRAEILTLYQDGQRRFSEQKAALTFSLGIFYEESDEAQNAIREYLAVLEMIVPGDQKTSQLAEEALTRGLGLAAQENDRPRYEQFRRLFRSHFPHAVLRGENSGMILK